MVRQTAVEESNADTLPGEVRLAVTSAELDLLKDVLNEVVNGLPATHAWGIEPESAEPLLASVQVIRHAHIDAVGGRGACEESISLALSSADLRLLRSAFASVVAAISPQEAETRLGVDMATVRRLAGRLATKTVRPVAHTIG
jgi:hypothetical protein